jgi:hypothetical protein
MFVTYKASKVDGYTKVAKSGLTQGGGWLAGPQGGGFGADLCGNQCVFDGGDSPKDNRATLVENYTISSGYCASSVSESCARQGFCGLNAGTKTGVANMESPYLTYTSSAKLFAKQTCVDGLTSTQSNSENPYTKTAELACTTSKNSGKDVGFAGAFPTSTKDCYYVTPAGAISLYAGGPNFPAELDSARTGSWCGAKDEDGSCIFTETCSGCIIVNATYYGGCGKADVTEGPLATYKTKDPCPIYIYSDCESAYILSKLGSYIAGGKNVGPFSTTTVHALATDKAVQFNIVTGKESPKIDQTFSYSNKEVTLSNLKAKESSYYTNSYVNIGESGASTTTYKYNAGGRVAGDPSTMFYSGEVKCTAKGEAGGGDPDPCCLKDCKPPPTMDTTDTLFAGSSFAFTHVKISTTKLGEYFAYQPTTISRGDHLAWGEFAYSTSVGGTYSSDYNNKEEFECESVEVTPVLTSVGTEYVAKCFDCVGGMVPVEYMAPNKSPGTAKCGDLDCGCTSAKGGNTEGPPDPPFNKAATQCYNPCASNKPCSVQCPGFTFGVPAGTCCCPDVPRYYSDQVSTKVFKNAIARTGNCKIADQYTYDVAYTHLTRAQTLTTGIGGLGFHATLQKSEGLYYLDSKGSMQTATSFSLKQSKSDITNSHVRFAFSGAYYNPMGRTTQFGSDGAKKTFIALATGDAVYLVGSPDGKSKGTATASHDGDVHSYYISDPDAKSVWNQASWPGHGVVNGKITTGTFSFSFNTGAFANSYGGGGGVARFSPGAKQTIVADGGLNIISSKANVSEKSFKTTYSTNAFSTSFDSTFKGAWIAKALPYTYVATRSVDLSPNPNVGIETNHVFSIYCPGCNFPQPGIPIPLLGDTSEYFIKGDKKLLYNNNATSYLWTHPAFKKKWGDGHGAECEE